MKNIKLLSIIFLIMTLFFGALHAHGHPPCETEKKAVDDAQGVLDDAQELLGQYERNLAILLLGSKDGIPPSVLQSAEEQIENQKNVVEDAEKALKDAKRDRDFCLAFAYRDCGCPVHDTQTLSSCGCDYKRWNGFCPCPARLPTT